MKIEGGSVVKSPWYYRTGSRPVGATRQLTYNAIGIGPHVATVRAQVSTTSTLNVRLGSTDLYFWSTSAGAASAQWGPYLTYDSTQQFGFTSQIQLSAGVNITPNYMYCFYLDEYLTVSGDTAYLMTVDTTTGAHLVNYYLTVSLEYFGK